MIEFGVCIITKATINNESQRQISFYRSTFILLVISDNSIFYTSV
jgi:hypothetical protein